MFFAFSLSHYCLSGGWCLMHGYWLTKHGHTIYSRNNMRQKCGGNCGLWILHEIIQNKYSENLRKIVGALWELPAK